MSAGQVQGEAQLVVELRMALRRQVVMAHHVDRPGQICRILRPRQHEPLLRQDPRRLDQEAIHGRLTIGAVGAEIAQREALRQAERAVYERIDRAVERACPARPEVLLEPGERGPAGKGEVEVEAGDQVGRQILVIAARELGERHRRVDVVERDHARGGRLHPTRDRHAVRHVGADHHDVRVRHRSREASPQLGEIPVERDPAPARARQVAMRAVPGHIALEESDGVAACRQRREQRAPGRGVAVPPGRGDRETKDRDPEPGHHATCCAGRERRSAAPSTSSTESAR
jgi:hypothetical protein